MLYIFFFKAMEALPCRKKAVPMRRFSLGPGLSFGLPRAVPSRPKEQRERSPGDSGHDSLANPTAGCWLVLSSPAAHARRP